ncbi:ABC transporter permease [Aggregatilineales bacterium SYSU G02658]
MTKYIARRVLQMIPTLLIIFTVIFVLRYLMPGDPLKATLGEEYNRLDPATIARLEEELGINRPFLVQYFDHLGRMLRLDLGRSFIERQPVIDIIGYRLPRTLQLMLGGIAVGLLIGIPAGVISALRQYSWLDHTLMVIALIGLSMPVFWQGLMAQLLLTQSTTGIKIFPVAGFGDGDPWYMVLPSLVLGTNLSAVVARITRTSMLEVKGQDYLKTARAKGLTNRVVLFRHHMRNAMLPIVTIVGLQFGGIMGGALVTETIFNWPGLGRVIVTAIQRLDTPVILGVLTMGALTFMVANLITDVIYALIDPRIRYN